MKGRRCRSGLECGVGANAAPVSPHQIMNYIAERVLELPKSY